MQPVQVPNSLRCPGLETDVSICTNRVRPVDGLGVKMADHAERG